MDISKTMKIAAAGMEAQGTRLRVIAENIANADSLARTPDGQPYRRKTVIFTNVLDRSLGVDIVEVGDIQVDRAPFDRRYNPNHPAADADGYVLAPNVNALVEMMDLREARRSYEANLRVMDTARRMLSRTLELLR